MDAAIWLVVGTITATFIIALGRGAVRVAKYQARLSADATVERIGDTLMPRVEEAIDDRLVPIAEQLKAIDHELTLNGGTTVKDAVYTLLSGQQDMQGQLERVLTTEPQRKEQR